MGKTKSNFSKFMLLWTGEFVSSIGGGLTSFGLGVYVFISSVFSSLLEPSYRATVTDCSPMRSIQNQAVW